MAKGRFSPEYTADDVLALYLMRSGDGDETRLRRLATTFRQLCRLDHAVKIPKQYEAITREVRTPFVRDTWHRVTASLVHKPPVGHITPKDEKREEYRDAANIAERWDAAMIERMSKDLGRDILYSLVSQLVRDGESVLKVVHRDDAWANFPEREGQSADEYNAKADEYKRGADLPIAWRDVDRLSMLFEDGEYGDLWAMEYGEFSRPYLRTKYGFAQGDDGKLLNPKGMLTGQPMPEGLLSTSGARSVRVQFFTSREWHVIVDGMEAPDWPKPNPYAPYLPYCRARALESESFLYSLMFLVPRLDEALTMKMNWAYLGAYPIPVLKTIPNQAGMAGLEAPLGDPGDATSDPKGGTVFTVTPGKTLELPLGKDASYLVPPPVGRDINDLILILRGLIDVAGIPSIFRGAGGADEAGYAINQRMAAANMAYKSASQASQRQIEQALEFTHWMVRGVIHQTVYVLGWQEINPKTGKPNSRAGQAWLGLTDDDTKQSKNVAPVTRLGPIDYSFRPTLPTDEQARAMIANQLVNAPKPLSSVRHAMETWLQEEDPDSIMDEIAVERAMDEEPLHSRMVQEALREAGMLPQGQAQPASPLVDQFGQPLMPPGPNQLVPGVPGQAAAGLPSVPGLNMPIQPTPPAGGGAMPGGRAPGAYPGQPGGPNR